MIASAVVLLIGDELLAGRTRDENGVWLAGQLTRRNVRVLGLRTLSDGIEDIQRAVRAAVSEADLVVVSGGLGPTEDDRTRQALAAAVGRPLGRDEAAYAHLTEGLARRGRQVGDVEARQALLPEGADALRNPVGIAPGMRLEIGETTLLSLPGVPPEWRAMCELHLLDGLVGGAAPAEERALWVAGLPESVIAERLAPILPSPHVALGSYPHRGEIELRLRAEGPEARRHVEAADTAAREILGARVYDPPPGGCLEHVVVEGLRARTWRLATAESVTGGLLARSLTRVPGASVVYPVGWVTYETAQKTARLGVPAALIERHGVVSAPVAVAMAEGARAKAGVQAALASTGTAGPGPLVEPGREPVPPGLVYVALAMEGRETEVAELALAGDRELVQRLAVVRALEMLRRALLG